jgi:hypothetical protein
MARDVQIFTGDNISENFSFLGRARWEFRPWSEIFIALGQTATIAERHSSPRARNFPSV